LKAIERIVGAVAELTIKSLEIYLRESGEVSRKRRRRRRAAPGKKAAKKRAPRKKARKSGGRRKKAAPKPKAEKETGGA
ncbi:MAG: hypothetical protein AB1742_05965, partial [bacterium]